MKKQIFLAALALMAIPSHALAARISAEDTVAGLGTEIFISGMEYGKKTSVNVIPPLGPQSVFPAVLDRDGNGKVKLPGTQTEVSGTYEIEVLQDGETISAGTFETAPDKFDPSESALQTDFGSISADSADSARVIAITRDRFGNTLKGRPVRLISSRPDDSINPLSSETDESGEQAFEVSSGEEGSMSLRAMDLLSGKLFENSVEIRAGRNASDFYRNPAVGGYPAEQARYNYPGYANIYPYQPQFYPPIYNQYPAQQSKPLYSGGRMVGSVIGSSLYGQVNNFDIVSGFQIGLPSELKLNQDVSIRITAVDQNGRRVEDYTGLVLLSSTDPAALLPLEGRIQFAPQNLGEKVLTLGLRFRTPGEHLIHAEDSTNPNISSQVPVTVASGGGNNSEPTIAITSHEQDQSVNTEEIVLEGNGPPFINLIVSGGEKDVSGETDEDGNFSITVRLNAKQTDHTLRVKDESGYQDSGNLHLILDKAPPEITSGVFDPAEPEEGRTVNLSVKTEGDAQSVILKIGEQEYPLEKSATESGAFSAGFAAPANGSHQPVVKASDKAGNIMEVRYNLIVRRKGLPKIQNVIAEEKPGAVSLSWDPVTEEEVSAYRIYIGKSPDDFFYTRDTARAEANTLITGLTPGITYYFAVTAIEGDRESAEKSDVIEYIMPGLSLKVTEQDSSLLLEWEKPLQDLPLASFILEYGTEKGSFTEKRTISGELDAYSLHDLLNGITYYLRLTPVSTTGNVLKEFEALGEGTPRSENGGFTLTPGQPVPNDLFPPNAKHSAPEITKHPGAPNPKSGLPLPAWAAIAVISVFGAFHWHRRKTLQMTLQFMRQMESQYRSR